MASALRRYAYAQARVRARLSRRLTREQLDSLAAAPDASVLQRELVALGWAQPVLAVLAAFEDVLRMLEGAPRAVVAAYRARYECENLGVLLRAFEKGLAYADVAPLLLPVGALGPGRRAEELLEASTLADGVARLDPSPFGDVLRRQVCAAGARGQPVDRFHLELVAERNVYEAAWRSIDALADRDRRSAAAVLGVELDCVNLIRSARLRQRHGKSPEEVLAYSIRGGLYLDAARRAVLAYEPVESWAAQLAATPYGAALAAAGGSPRLELELGRVRAQSAERALSSSPFAIGLVLAHLVLVEIQATDLQRLVEGKRLGLPESWLRAGLVSGRRR